MSQPDDGDRLSWEQKIDVAASSTESRRSEEAIRDSEQRYRVILHSMSDAVFIVNHRGIIETINDAAAALGYVASGGLSVGVHLRAVLPLATADRRLEAMRAVLVSREPSVIDEEISSKGSTVYLSTTVNPLCGADGSCTKVVMVSRDITAGKEREVFLRRFSKSILSAQEAERRRVAGEVHDGLAQSLAALRVALGQIARDMPPDDATRRARIEEAIASVGALMEDARRIAHNLTPTILEDLGLTAAIERLVRTFADSGELVAEGHVIALDGVFLPEEEIHIYRVVQEVLNNIHRHARARHMDLTVRRVLHAVEFEVRDDGVGFRANQALSTSAHDSVHQGLHDLQERARLLNGTLAIRSKPGEGTTIVLTIPVVVPPSVVPAGGSA